MNNSERKYRMYGLVPYNLSPIQQGIQFGHAVVEYSLLYWDTPEYQKWAKEDKTFIILDGGTTSTNPLSPGTLNQHASALRMVGNLKKTAVFYEPDLGDQLTAVVFLADDRVWDRDSWKEYDGIYYASGQPEPTDYWNWKMKFSDDEKEADRIVWLRNFLKQFRLA